MNQTQNSFGYLEPIFVNIIVGTLDIVSRGIVIAVMAINWILRKLIKDVSLRS